jgi:hypothetical protein
MKTYKTATGATIVATGQVREFVFGEYLVHEIWRDTDCALDDIWYIGCKQALITAVYGETMNDAIDNYFEKLRRWGWGEREIIQKIGEVLQYNKVTACPKIYYAKGNVDGEYIGRITEKGLLKVRSIPNDQYSIVDDLAVTGLARGIDRRTLRPATEEEIAIWESVYGPANEN